MKKLTVFAASALALSFAGSAFAEVEVKPYGFVKFDLAYDTAAVTPGNFALLVPKGAADSDGHFTSTANQSRFGLAIKAAAVEGVSTRGKIEMDLYGGEGSKGYANGANQAAPRLRHAFGVVRWEAQDLELLAGQSWDLHSPNNPSLLNFGVQWKSGNIGFRRPQLRLTKGLKLGANRMTVAVALSENTDGAGMATTPITQGRVGMAFGKVKVGVSGHYGKEKTEADDFATWSSVLDLSIPLGGALTLKAEAWFGENTHAYLGNTGPEQKSFGTWAALAVKACTSTTFNVGFGMEKADDEEATAAAGGITQNLSGYANVFYMLAPNAKVGVEGSYWKTEYGADLDAEDNIRGQTSFIFAF